MMVAEPHIGVNRVPGPFSWSQLTPITIPTHINQLRNKDILTLWKLYLEKKLKTLVREKHVWVKQLQTPVKVYKTAMKCFLRNNGYIVKIIIKVQNPEGKKTYYSKNEKGLGYFD